jgi:hypothetical protein
MRTFGFPIEMRRSLFSQRGFPVLPIREFHRQSIVFLGVGQAPRAQYRRHSLFSRWSGNLTNGDPFAADCQHSHRVRRFPPLSRPSAISREKARKCATKWLWFYGRRVERRSLRADNERFLALYLSLGVTLADCADGRAIELPSRPAIMRIITWKRPEQRK